MRSRCARDVDVGADVLTVLPWTQEESKAYTAHARTLRQFHKEELAFFAARAKFERMQANLQVRIEIYLLDRDRSVDRLLPVYFR